MSHFARLSLANCVSPKCKCNQANCTGSSKEKYLHIKGLGEALEKTDRDLNNFSKLIFCFDHAV